MKKNNLSEKMFFIGYIILLIGYMLDTSKYNILKYGNLIINSIQIIGCIILIIKVLIDFKEMIKLIKIKENIKYNYLMILFILICFISFIITKSKIMVFLPLTIISASNVDFKKILKYTLYVQIFMLIFIICSYYLGIIENVVVWRESDIRTSLGSNSPNCLVLQVFQILLLYLYIKKDKISILELILSITIITIFYILTDSRMGVICSILLLIAFYLIKLKIIKNLIIKLKYIVIALPLILSILSLVLILLYKPYNLEKLNIFFTDRIRLGYEGYMEYGITLFGNEIEWIGQLSESEKEGKIYNYVDNSYLNTLYNYGIIILIYVTVFMSILTINAYKRKDYLMISFIVIIELYCFFDSWLIGICFNTFLLLLGIGFYSYRKEIKMSNKNKIISFSVACYNLENLIEDNLKSFINPNIIDKIEVIITDDGSSDNSIKIIEKYVKKYPNTFKLIKQKNSGPGSTVNSGIKNAKGKYFKMIDGDDWVQTNNLEVFIESLENNDADMIISDYDIYDESQKKIIKTENYDLENNKLLEFDDVSKYISQEMHAITYKTEILKKNKIKVDNGFYTDVEYVIFPIPYVKKVLYVNKSIYVYRIAREGQSVSPKSLIKNINQHYKILNELIDYENIKKNNITKYQEDYISKRLGVMASNHLYIMLLLENNNKQKESIKKFIKSIKTKNKKVFKYLKQSKKYSILVYSNYLLYNYLSNKMKKRAGI